MLLTDLAAEIGGEVRVAADGPLRRIGVALDAGTEVVDWAQAEGLDAVVLHRAHGLQTAPEGVGIVGCHDWLDAHIPVWLAEDAGLRSSAPLLDHEDVVVGTAPADLRERVRELLGGEESFHPGEEEHVSVAVIAGAMTESLVRAASEEGASLYVTGQWRAQASNAVEETGIAVQVCGHRRLERWALEALADRLEERHEDLDVVVAPEPGWPGEDAG
jgi:putative NIF3 family GTP cyclohydrolase 1 type 2